MELLQDMNPEKVLTIIATAMLFMLFVQFAAFFGGLKRLRLEREKLRTNEQELLQGKIQAETLLLSAKEQLEQVMRERDEAFSARDEEKNLRHQAEVRNELLLQEQALLKKQMEDFEKHKAEMTGAAKSALLESGTDVIRKEVEKVTKSTMEHMQQVLKNFHAVHAEQTKHALSISTLQRMLSSPTAAGQFSEIGLENTFKNYGLTPGRDFIMQYGLPKSEGGLRPDALVFLPGNHLLVVDSKASHLYYELAQVKDTPQEKEIADRLKISMQRQMQSLSGKGYKEAIQSLYKQLGRGHEVQHILTVMFLQTESAVETLLKIDPEFRHKCEKCDIAITGPAGLSGLLSFSRFQIVNEQQQQNFKTIMEELSGFMDTVRILAEYAEKMRKGVLMSAQGYEGFAASFNRNFLSKARKLLNLGVTMGKQKTLPEHLQTLHITQEKPAMIDVTPASETDDNVAMIEPKKVSSL